MTTDATQAALVDRLRGAFADEPTLREVAMFGGRAFMVRGAMVVSSRRGGALLARVADARGPELLDRAGASAATMGVDRPMGPGWIDLEAAAIDDDEELGFWLAEALAHNRSTTGIA